MPNIKLRESCTYKIRINPEHCCSGIEDYCTSHNITTAMVRITSMDEPGGGEVTVRFLDPHLYAAAGGFGGHGHNSVKRYDFLALIPESKDNELGNFPKLDAPRTIARDAAAGPGRRT